MDAFSLADNPKVHHGQPHRHLNEAGKGVLATLGIFWTIAIASVALRFYVRYIRGGVFLLEDYLALFGLLALSAQCLFAVSLGSVKISITLFIFRAFTGQGTAFRVAGGIVLVTTILWTIATLLVTFLICRPITLIWSLLPVNGMCGNPKAAYVSIAGTDILTDLMIILLPQPVIWRLHLPVKLKVAITGIVGIGMLWVGNRSSASIEEIQSRVPPYDKPRSKSPWFSCWRRRGNSAYGDSLDNLPLSYYTAGPQFSNRLHQSNALRSMSKRTWRSNQHSMMTGNMDSVGDSGVGSILVEKSITTY
ncbi:hypothetical protein KEM54_001986 [Ascosphaera aggregata]|nr:hypothetical protein KEM54_001986 [Ascosphaera aggregata]